MILEGFSNPTNSMTPCFPAPVPPPINPPYLAAGKVLPCLSPAPPDLISSTPQGHHEQRFPSPAALAFADPCKLLVVLSKNILEGQSRHPGKLQSPISSPGMSLLQAQSHRVGLQAQPNTPKLSYLLHLRI